MAVALCISIVTGIVGFCLHDLVTGSARVLRQNEERTFARDHTKLLKDIRDGKQHYP